MTQEKLAAIKTRIAKLLAMAEGTTNDNEAESFMAKVQELLELHEIEIHEIRMHSGVDNDPMGMQDGAANIYASMSWAKMVTHQLAVYYGCTTVWYRKGNHLPYKIFGRDSARVTTELMLPYVLSQVKVQARAFARDYGYTDAVAQRNVGLALSSRIFKMTQAAKAHRAELESNALVPVNNVEQFVNDYFGGKLKEGRGSKKGYSGRAADYADKISINRQAAHEKRKLLA